MQLLKAQLLQGNFQVPDDLQKARVLYESCVKLAAGTSLATSPLLWNNIAMLRLALHDKKDALVAADEALQLAGRCYHVNDNWAKAREMYEKAIRANKKNILAQYEMIQMWEFSGRET